MNTNILKLKLKLGLVENKDDLLIDASVNGHLDVVKLLIEYGADVTAKDNQAICWACIYDHSKIVKLLIKHGAPKPTKGFLDYYFDKYSRIKSLK
jgi:ankyrin repeat protein